MRDAVDVEEPVELVLRRHRCDVHRHVPGQPVQHLARPGHERTPRHRVAEAVGELVRQGVDGGAVAGPAEPLLDEVRELRVA